MNDILGEVRLSSGVVAGRHTVQAFQGDEHLFTVTAESEQEALGEARRRLQGHVLAPAAPAMAGAGASSLSPISDGAILARLPEVADWREATARKLLDGLLESEGHAQLSSTFNVRPSPNPDGEKEAFWTEAAGKKGDIGSPTPRHRAYLAFYWLVSRNGKLFYGRGIRLGAKMLWPDKGVMRNCLAADTPLVAMVNGRFILTPAGESVVREVITLARWPSLVSATPEAAPLASAVTAIAV